MKSILIRPNKENITTFVSLGSCIIFIGFLDLLASTFLNINITSFLPSNLSFFTPLALGTLGLYLIRIEFSGNKILDKLNTNFNSNNFNAVLTLLVIFALAKFNVITDAIDVKFIEDIFTIALAIFVMFLFYPYRKTVIKINKEDRLLLFGVGIVLIFTINYKELYNTIKSFSSKYTDAAINFGSKIKLS